MTRREERVNGLVQMSKKSMLNRILEYPDQDQLNQNPRFPAGRIAQQLKDNGQRMTPKQRYALANTFVDRTQAQVIPKEQELSKLSRRDLIDRVCAYSDQARLNYTLDGETRSVPYGEMAQHIQKNHYRMSERQREILIQGFAELTANETLEMEQAHDPAFTSPKGWIPQSDQPSQPLIPDPVLEEGQTFYYKSGVEQDAVGPKDAMYQQSYLFAIEAYAPDPEDRQWINDSLKRTVEEEHLTESLNRYLKENNEGQAPEVSSVTWELTSESQGEIRVTSPGPMSKGAIRDTERWIDKQQEGPIEDCLMGFTGNNGIYGENIRTHGLISPIVRPFLSQESVSQTPDLTLTDADLEGLSDDEVIKL